MEPRPRYLFVGGLHRSGTSLVARLAAGLPGAGGIVGAPVPENEGVYLQGGIPHDALAGRPMHFATDPAQHLTEAHPLNRLETRQRIDLDWDRWFDPGARWRVEKSPVNLMRMRLMQALYPLAQFVVVLRHPEAVAAANAKWADRAHGEMIDHWLGAHDIVADDMERLHALLILRYEDVVADPGRAVRQLAAFMDTGTGTSEPLSDGNADYAPAPMTAAQGRRATRWGYASGMRLSEPQVPVCRHPLRAVRETVAVA